MNIGVKNKLISNQIIFSVIGIYILLSTILSTILISYEFYSAKITIDNNLKLATGSFTDALGRSLFVSNNEMTDALILGLKNNPSIIDIKIVNKRGKTSFDITQETKGLIKKNSYFEKVSIKKINLPQQGRRKNRKVGILYLYYSNKTIFEKIINSFIQITIYFSIVTLTFFLLLKFLIKKLLADPILALTKCMTEQELTDLKKAEFVYKHNNEIIMLKNAYNILITKITESRNERDELYEENRIHNQFLHEQKINLEKTIEKRLNLIDSIVRVSMNVKNNATKTGEVVGSGKKIQGKLIDEMGNIKNSNEELKELLDKIKDIRKKTIKIHTIVNESKLLSFNAEIEAAHAGMFGKGFSVVATEIGKLASLSGEISEDISKIVSSTVDKSIAVMKNTTKSIKYGGETALQSQESFNNIDIALGEVLKQVDEIISKSIELDKDVSKDKEERNSKDQDKNVA